MRQRINFFLKRWQRVPLAVLLAFAIAYLTRNYMGWLAYDDEGGYLYAGWRITLGELPYRDFLTPQLPIFLYPGAAVLGLTGLSVLAARLYMLALCLGVALLLYLTLKHVGHPRAAWIALPLLLVHHDIFWAARFFRPEAPMLLFAALGMYLFVRGYPTEQHKTLAWAGVALGLSMMSKLFGALPMAGVGLFVLFEGWRTRRWRQHIVRLLYVSVPFVLTVLLIGGLFTTLAPNFAAAVLGHHVRQGSGMPFLQVARKTLDLFRSCIVFQPVYVLLVAAGIALGWRSERWDVRLFAWQLPTALAFFVITRDLQPRHLAYLAPSCAALAAMAVDRAWGWLAPAHRWLRPLGGLGLAGLVALAIWPHILDNETTIKFTDPTTVDWISFIQGHTEPDDVVISDYPGLNFFSRRRTTRTAAGLSGGATQSGQILGADLIREMEQSNVRMVIYNVAHGSHQIIQLHDYDTFKQYVQSRFQLIDRRHYDYRLMEVYCRDDVWDGRIEAVNFENQLALSGLDWTKSRAEPGQNLQIRLRWKGTALMEQDYGVTLQLLDQKGHLWGLGHKTLGDIEGDTYWDEHGLEQPLMIPTSQWPVDEMTVQTFELPIDAATPPGSYRVILRVHPKETWDGLHILDASGAVIGHDWHLGDAQVLSARRVLDPAALGIDRRVDADLAPALRLLGHSTPPAEVRPGDTFSVSLYWKKVARTRSDYQLELTLQGNGKTWGRTVTSPARPEYPIRHWYPGEVLRGQQDLLVDAETPTGAYTLYAALLDDSGLRVTEPFAMGSIHVKGRQRTYETPQMAYPVKATLGGLVELLGYDVASPTVSYRNSLSLTLYWRADDRTRTSYKVFVHLIDEQDKVWAQQDSEPMDGTYPTTAWLPGEIISDAYVIPIPEVIAPGPYWVEVGMYEPLTGKRLAVVNAQGQKQINDRVLLQRVFVQE